MCQWGGAFGGWSLCTIDTEELISDIIIADIYLLSDMNNTITLEIDISDAIFIKRWAVDLLKKKMSHDELFGFLSWYKVATHLCKMV